MSKRTWSNPLEDLFADKPDGETTGPSTPEPQPAGWTFACDARLRYSYCSPEVEDRLGFSPRFFAGKGLLHFAISVESALSLKTALETQEPPFELQVTFKNKQGDPVPAYLNLMQTADREGSPTGWHGFAYLMNAPGEAWAGEQVIAEKTAESLENLLGLTENILTDLLSEISRKSPILAGAKHGQIRRDEHSGRPGIGDLFIRYRLEWGEKFDFTDREAALVAEKRYASATGWLGRILAPKRILKSDFNRVNVILSNSRTGLQVWVDAPANSQTRRRLSATDLVNNPDRLRAEIERALENPFREKEIYVRGRDYLIQE